VKNWNDTILRDVKSHWYYLGRSTAPSPGCHHGRLAMCLW